MGRRKKMLELSKEYLSSYKYKVKCIIGKKAITLYTDFSPVIFIRNMHRYNELKDVIPNKINFYDNSNNQIIDICILDENTYIEKGIVHYLAFRYYKDINP